MKLINNPSMEIKIFHSKSNSISTGKVKDDTIPAKWKWVNAKQSGARPSPRCGLSCAVAPGNRAFCFGGVFDEVL